MATNQQRARLIGRKVVVHEGRDPQHGCPLRFSDCPDYDTDLNAVAELRAFVRARGKEIEFVYALDAIVRPNTRFNLIDATPAQQCAAFDAVFKDELEKNAHPPEKKLNRTTMRSATTTARRSTRPSS